MMAPTREHEQVIKILQQLIGMAAFFSQAGPISPGNAPLHRILVETSKYVLGVGAQIDDMQEIAPCRSQTQGRGNFPELFVHGTEFQVPPTARVHIVLRLMDE